MQISDDTTREAVGEMGWINQYDNVEISANCMVPTYVFKLRDISPVGMGVLVKEDSDLLNQIEMGQILNMRYNLAQRADSSACFETLIEQITKDAQGRFKGHLIVGLSVLKNDGDVHFARE